jgi:hypothetical protein
MKLRLAIAALSVAFALNANRAEACTMASECTSGFCVDGVCCDSECTGACRACSAARKGSGSDGTCGDVAPGTACGLFVCSAGACPTTCASDTDCASTAYCDATSCVAKKANGATATDKKQCTSGFLADGVCCDAACDGVCEACDVTTSVGTCSPVAGAPKHGACPTGSDVCGAATCDGVARAECKKFPGAEKECRSSACADGVETLSARCDGMGACPAVATKMCGEYVCDGTRCRTTCRSNPDCASGYVCDDVETKKCLSANTCDGDHTVKGRNGVDADCTPYKCDKDKCLNKCLATSQCTAGFICNGTECVRSLADAPPADEGDGGCAFGPPSTLGRTFVLGVALAIAVSLRRRR